MVLSIPENATKLWDLWNIRAFIILSLSVQAFLILFAPLRKRGWGKRGRCLDMMLWLAYLLADWVAGVTIGFILSNQVKTSGRGSDIQVFWAPFLLLHLGGPDNITSFALEDNEFWVRHLLGLALQVGSTLYALIMSLPNNDLWLPTLLVLVAGIIKYVERNLAFYLASFDHLGCNWVPSEWQDGIRIPKQFQKMDSQATFDDKSRSIPWSAVHHLGSIKKILVGPFITQNQCSDIRETFLQEEAGDALRIMEIELSLLYEVLHTKLPVVDCRTGYFFRVISLVCVLGALLSFSVFKKHYELLLLDILLTYGLLIGALTLDLISMIWLVRSDWIFVTHLQSMKSCIAHLQCMKSYINKKRWSNVVSQLNFVTYYLVKDFSFGLKIVADFVNIKSLLEEIKGFRYLSSQNFEESEWCFIFKEVKELNAYLIRKLKESAKTVPEAEEVWLYSHERVLKYFSSSEQLIITQITEDMDYTKRMLTWHIATELCFQVDQTPTSGNASKELCKKLSDYMFYLAVMQPTMMTEVSVNWKTVLDETLVQTHQSFVSRSSIPKGEVDVCKQILQPCMDPKDREKGKKTQKLHPMEKSVLPAAIELACQLKQSDSTYPWESMSKVWVQLMCTAAINCRPIVHAQQPSKGGELLTFVWLFMNHLGLRTHFSTHYQD